MSDHLTLVDHPLVQHKLTLMREKSTSTAVFRQLLREISHLLAYEVTRDLPMTTTNIDTPLVEMDAPTLQGKLALISILRAGNGLLDGVMDLIPSARVGFVGLYRDEETLKPVQYYYKVPGGAEQPRGHRGGPDAGDRQFLRRGHRPAQGLRGHRHPLPVPARRARGRRPDEGAHPDVPIITAALDERLNEKGYILPGLGDAGDRMFGTKSRAVRRARGARRTAAQIEAQSVKRTVDGRGLRGAGAGPAADWAGFPRIDDWLRERIRRDVVFEPETMEAVWRDCGDSGLTQGGGSHRSIHRNRQPRERPPVPLRSSRLPLQRRQVCRSRILRGRREKAKIVTI